LEISYAGHKPEFPCKVFGSKPINILRDFIEGLYSLPKTGRGHFTIKNPRASRRECERNTLGNVEDVPGPGRKDYRVAHGSSKYRWNIDCRSKAHVVPKRSKGEIMPTFASSIIASLLLRRPS
jgi:hypothetical protein